MVLRVVIMQRIRNFGILIILCLIAVSCSLIKPSEEKKAEKATKKEIKAIDKDLRKREKAHWKNQTPEAKKMMKRTKKHSKKLNKPRKLPK